MLIKFTVSNFLSFKSPTSFDMLASNERIHPHHVVRTASRLNPNLLRIGVVYGANAAGKSNLVKALKFFRDLIVEGRSPDARIPIQRFRLDSACSKEPSTFEAEFRTHEINYRYSVSVGQQRIYRENLKIINSNADTLLFDRTTSDDDRVEVHFGPFYKKLKEKERLLIQFIADGTRPNQLFLRETIERNEERFRLPYNWFHRVLRIIDPSVVSSQLELRLENDNAFKDFLCRVMIESGTGITDVVTDERSIDSYGWLPSEVVENARERLPENGAMFIHASPLDERVTLVKRGDDIRVLSLRTMRGTIPFEVREESDGTQRLFDFVPMLYGLTVGKLEQVIVVDEIGRSLHPHLTQLIVDMHLDETNADKPTQLIITTHETNLLDLDILRRDEIWFAEKRRDGSTDLYSLNDFQPRYNKDIRRDYLVGRYGGIPFIGGASQLLLVPEDIGVESIDAA